MWYDFSRWAQSNREKDVKRLKKLSRGAYEDTKGSVRALEALIEVALLTSAYYLVWRNLYDFSMFAYKGKYVKIKYITQLKTAYPQFVFYCNLPQYVKEPYKRFVENRLREMYNFNGVPITIYFRAK